MHKFSRLRLLASNVKRCRHIAQIIFGARIGSRVVRYPFFIHIFSNAQGKLFNHALFNDLYLQWVQLCVQITEASDQDRTSLAVVTLAGIAILRAVKGFLDRRRVLTWEVSLFKVLDA